MEEALGALHDEPPPFTFSCVPLCCVHIAQQHTAALRVDRWERVDLSCRRHHHQ